MFEQSDLRVLGNNSPVGPSFSPKLCLWNLLWLQFIININLLDAWKISTSLENSMYLLNGEHGCIPYCSFTEHKNIGCLSGCLSSFLRQPSYLYFLRSALFLLNTSFTCSIKYVILLQGKQHIFNFLDVWTVAFSYWKTALNWTNDALFCHFSSCSATS